MFSRSVADPIGRRGAQRSDRPASAPQTNQSNETSLKIPAQSDSKGEPSANRNHDDLHR